MLALLGCAFVRCSLHCHQALAMNYRQATTLVNLVLLFLQFVLCRIVHTGQGSLLGFIDKSRNGIEFTSFLGIPYAKPPVGDLRLKDPERPVSWFGVRNASTYGSPCLQRHQFTGEIVGEEDCLFLNVYTPEFHSDAKLPVMVYIHEGAYVRHSCDTYGAQYLMDKNVVFVCMNFRLSALGFMSFNDELFPGNFGLKDQIMALEWVQENIEYFGGDPNSVTLFSGSSGGASVDILLLSPLTKGLFHKAILQSGTAANMRLIGTQTALKQRSEAGATLLGCPIRPTSEVLSCLRKILAKQFITMYEKFHEWDSVPLRVFLPVMDSFSKDKSVLPDHPLLLLPHKMPVMIGGSSREGSLEAVKLCHNDFKYAKIMERRLPRSLLVFLGIQDHISESRQTFVVNSLLRYYLNNQTLSADNIDNFQRLATDIEYHLGAYRTALQYFKHTDVFFYLNDVAPPQSLFGALGHCPSLKGPGHGDERIYFFKSSQMYPNYQESEEDVQMSNLFLDLWTNFAAKGYPGNKWSAVESDKIEYFYIGNDDVREMRASFVTDGIKFVDYLSSLEYPDEGFCETSDNESENCSKV